MPGSCVAGRDVVEVESSPHRSFRTSNNTRWQQGPRTSVAPDKQRRPPGAERMHPVVHSHFLPQENLCPATLRQHWVPRIERKAFLSDERITPWH